jgi:hypothetical protein
MGIDRAKYGSQGYESKPKLTAEMVQGQKTVLTIQDIREISGQNGPTLAITFEEFPDHTFWTNKTQQDALIAAVDAELLPDDWSAMVGARIPFYKKQNTNPENQQKVWKLYPSPVELWNDHLDAFDKAKASKPASARR